MRPFTHIDERVSHTYEITTRIFVQHMCDVTHSHVWHELFTRVA